MRLEAVHYIPAALEPGVLYVSDQYKIAMHLCACGCGSRVPVSLGPAGWTVTVRNGKPTVRPSIGSGQLPCNSHYYITDGRVDWLRPMTASQTVAALQFDHRRREDHYRGQQRGFFASLWHRIRRLLGYGN
nr:DUF6527 family protein [Mesorhizobium japonicum]